MPDITIIGPGRPCSICGGTYGQHTRECSYPSEQRVITETLGRAFREALEKKDDLAVGTILSDLIKRR